MLPDRCGIVVATCDANARTWLPDCLRSLAPLPVTLAWNTPEANHYDAGALFTGWEAGFDEWWVMPDTVVVTDQAALLERLGDKQSWSLGGGFISCIGKVCRWDVEAEGLPSPPGSKRQAVDLEMSWFSHFATNRCGVIDQSFRDNDAREDRHGRSNMVLRSTVLTKFKGHWSLGMIPD